MKQAKLGAWIVLAVAMGLSTVGCAQKDKDQIQQLTQRNNELDGQNKELRDQLAAAKTHEETLGMQLAAKQTELDAALARLRDQENKPSAKTPPSAAPAAGWQRGDLGDMATVGSDILFGPGKATLTPEGKKRLDKIAADLKNTYSGSSIRVYGYTDTDPIRKSKELWQDNLDLSANRAMAVTRHLISKGINAGKIETVAMGETHPVASNKDSAGRTKNRRVEIIALRKK
ncbi:MAG: OmpA family protein [Phycisphaerae bacterium]|jgi:outer membrane protein OmpA-like peptidoglycan-associated protein